MLISKTKQSKQWYHPSQFLWSQSWFHLCLWHVFLYFWRNCIQFVSFSHLWQSSFCSDSSCEFTQQFSFSSSKLDYCNSLYSVISQATLNKFQRIQNPLASVIINTSKYQHITPLLKKPHWLRTLSFHMQNTYFTIVFNFWQILFQRTLETDSDSLVLSILFVWSSIGKRAFSVIGSRLWNSLPPDTRNSSSLLIFRSKLKTHLFKIAFPP